MTGSQPPREYLADRVCETLANDQASASAIERLVGIVLRKEGDVAAFRLDEAVGNAVCVWIGERMKQSGKANSVNLIREHVAGRGFTPVALVDQDGAQALLWMTFMTSVDWRSVGKYFRDGRTAAE